MASFFNCCMLESLKFEVVLKKLLALPQKLHLYSKKKRKRKEFYIPADLYNLKSIEILGIYTWSIQLEVYKH